MKTYCILGNCQANALASTLQVCAEFKANYALQRVTPIHRITEEEHQKFLNDLLPNIDLFMYQPISQTYRGGGFGSLGAVAKLSTRTIVLSYPSIQFYGYHASAKTPTDMPVDLREKYHELFGLAGLELFHFSQVILAFLKGMSESEACTVFHGGFAGDAEFVQRECTRSLAHLHRSEVEYNIDARVHDAIAAGYRRDLLFWSPRHPSGKVLGMIAEQVLKRLEITPTEEEKARFLRRDPLTLPRYPLQDFARRALDLEFEPLTAFESRSARKELPELIAAYYSGYEAMGRANVLQMAGALFPTLPSWKAFQAELM